MGLFLYGCGGIGVVASEVAADSNVPVAGFFDDAAHDRPYRGHVVREGVERDPSLTLGAEQQICICLGDNHARACLSRRFQANLATLIHPSALISPTASLGKGTLIFHAARVQAETVIGDGVILNTGASVDHDCHIGDYVHVAPNVTLCGFVTVGEGANIGAGSIVIPGKRIGKWATLGAGTVVIDDIPDYATAVGCPARIVRIGDAQAQARRPGHAGPESQP